MTEFSAWWTTSGTPSGHQQISYTQAQLSIIGAIFAGGSAFEGVLPDYLNELVGSVPGANTFRIGTGGCVCDGKAYKNDAAEDVTIISAVGGGNTRIDRIVIRANWSAFTAEVHLISGVDAASPSPPAITQTSGTTYDIMLYQVLVDTAGTVTEHVDERVWAVHEVDDSTIEVNAGQLRVKSGGILTGHLATNAVETADIKDLNVTSSKLAANAVIAGKINSGAINSSADFASGVVDDAAIGNLAVGSAELKADAVIAGKIAAGGVAATNELANNIVDDTKVGNRVPQFYRRQGGSATNWQTSGLTSYTPAAVRMQGGSFQLSMTSGETSVSQSITFPVTFSNVPIIFISIGELGFWEGDAEIFTQNTDAAGTELHFRRDTSGFSSSVIISWLAIGPE